jgi:CheY-like chemotaxis protein
MKKLDFILLIDDDDEDNYFHQLVIEESSSVNSIKIIESGFEALAYIKNAGKRPDLIFLDANMPKMNGWEFVEKYKKLDIEQKSEAIIIMLTTSLNPADKERAKNIPEIKGFETKPLTAEAFDKILWQYFKIN